MLKDVLARIEQRLKALGISASAASRQAGLSEDAIRNMRRAVEKDERQGVSTATIIALAPVLQTSASWLIEGGGSEDVYVRIIGMVGADNEGSVIQTTGQESGDTARAPPGASRDTVALKVSGHSMHGIAHDGALLYFNDQRTPPGPHMLGEVCVVETEDGRVLVKRLLKGSHPGVYDLESANGPTIGDVKLRWAALITYTVHPQEARRLIRLNGERQVA